MSDHAHTEEMLKHIRIYVVVFLALAVLTGVTIWASYLDVSKPMHISIALLIATVKGSLVVAFFMHVISERKMIYSLLILTFFFFVFMMVFIYFADLTRGPRGPELFKFPEKKPKAAASHAQVIDPMSAGFSNLSGTSFLS